jgi:hypothetical protein
VTRKSAFNAEEWSLVAEGPLLAALTVVAADRGGTIRESMSLARAYAEARKEGGSELLDELLAAPPSLDPQRFGSPGDLSAQGEQRMREAVAVVDRVSTPEEADAYRAFVRRVADAVAHAHKEGGFLGVGGKQVSEAEQAALDRIAAAVG